MNDRDTTPRDTTVRDTTQGDVSRTDAAQDVRDSGRPDVDAGFLPRERMDSLRDEWSDVQAAFVDDPRSAVQRAQQLVTDLVNELTRTFARERENLEGQWSQGGDADTEALRVALQRYRSFFNRLLNT